MTYKVYSLLKDNNLLFIFLNYIIKTSTYRNIGAFLLLHVRCTLTKIYWFY